MFRDGKIDVTVGGGENGLAKLQVVDYDVAGEEDGRNFVQIRLYEEDEGLGSEARAKRKKMMLSSVSKARHAQKLALVVLWMDDMLKRAAEIVRTAVGSRGGVRRPLILWEQESRLYVV